MPYLGYIFTIIWDIVNSPLGALLIKIGFGIYLISKLKNGIVGLKAVTVAFGITMYSVFWWFSAILGVVLLIQDAWKTFTDPNSDTLFRNLYNWVKGIADALHIKFAELFGNEDAQMQYIYGSNVNVLPSNATNRNSEFNFNISQIFNGKVDNETAENYKQATKDMADMTENRYSEYYMADYRG